MSFSRIKYDTTSYDLKMQRETNPGDYRLFKGYNENCSRCFSYDGPKNAKSDVSLTEHDPEAEYTQWSSMTETESYLTNRVNKLTDDNIYGKNDYYKNLPVVNKNTCNTILESEDTRFTAPIEAYRCIDATPYHFTPYLSINPQCEVQDNDDKIGLNSRLKAKDTFIPNKPNVIDQSSILPNYQTNNQTNTENSSCAVIVNPLNADTVNFCKNN